MGNRKYQEDSERKENMYKKSQIKERYSEVQTII